MITVGLCKIANIMKWCTSVRKQCHLYVLLNSILVQLLIGFTCFHIIKPLQTVTYPTNSVQISQVAPQAIANRPSHIHNKPLTCSFERNSSNINSISLLQSSCSIWKDRLGVSTNDDCAMSCKLSRTALNSGRARGSAFQHSVTHTYHMWVSDWVRTLNSTQTVRHISQTVPQNFQMLHSCWWTLPISVKSRIQYTHLYNMHPKLSQENHGKTLV